MNKNVRSLNLPEQLDLIAMPPSEERDDGLGRNFSRFLPQGYIDVGGAFHSIRGVTDLYFYPLAFNYEGIIDAINTIGKSAGIIFVIASKEVGNSKEMMARRDRINCLTARIDEYQFSLAIGQQEQRYEALVWNSDKQEFQATRDFKTFRPFGPGRIKQPPAVS